MQYKELGSSFAKAVKSMTSEPVKETYKGMKARLSAWVNIFDDVDKFKDQVGAILKAEEMKLSCQGRPEPVCQLLKERTEASI